MIRIAPVLLAFACFALAADVRADVPNPNETCSLSSEKGPDATCEECSASHDAADACKTKHASDGLKFRCKTSGATVWTEIWCNNDSKPASSGCANADAASLGALAVLGVVLTRRRARVA